MREVNLNTLPRSAVLSFTKLYLTKLVGQISIIMKYKKIRLLYELQNYVVQALRAVSHNYPNVMSSYWQQVSTIVFKILKAASPEVPAKAWKGHVGNTAGFTGEKVVTAAIKVLSFSYLRFFGFKFLCINVQRDKIALGLLVLL